MAADGTMFLFHVCFRSCFQVFHLYVVYVAIAIYICCKYIFQVFQLFHTYLSRVSSVCFKCFILTLQKDMKLHILQWLHTCVLSVCFTCFTCFRRMLQIYVPNFSDACSCVLSKCCNDYISMFQ
jgi:hypothetical protein